MKPDQVYLIGQSVGEAYSLGRWPALVRYIDDGDLPADNKSCSFLLDAATPKARQESASSPGTGDASPCDVGSKGRSHDTF